MATVALAAAAGAALAVGSYLLFSGSTTKNKVEGARQGSSRLTSSTEGEGLTILTGRQRLDGQVIWATQFKEQVVTETTSTETGGKGGGGGATVETETTTYNYSISLAIAFCRGNSKTTISRMWADGIELDMSRLNFRFYPGSQTQDVDPKIEEVQGTGNTPAYRGVAYLVLEDLQLEEYGNRVPQLTAEIVVPVETDDPVDIQNAGKAFTLIPTAGETVYSPSKVQLRVGGAQGNYASKADNVHNAYREPDVVRSLKDLSRMQNNLDAILVAVSWFGSDLRAGNCTVRPKVEDYSRDLSPAWSVNGQNRDDVEEVSRDGNNRPIFGGTPSDQSLVELIQHIKGQGQRVVFYPFILMDVTDGNTLPNPYSDNASATGQAPIPWRGRVTCSPAPGYAGTPDKTAATAAQINNFFDEYDAMVEHYAQLCDDAGGVDGFVIGSELVGLTTSRDALGSYPAVDRLVSLATAVKSIVGSGTDVTYAADWSEWVHDHPDGLFYHLDPLWSSPSIDACGVDNYLPLGDWRDGTQHDDYDGVNGPVSPYDPDYIKSQIEGGEYYDYYYASQADREAQVRTPITDGAYGEPEVYRRKDFRYWWLNQHRNRPGGVRDASPTDWVPGSKPIWFTEFGVPAVDKGTNQPNVFYDPKSSESAFPYFSSGARDDFIQRVAVEAVLEYWGENSPESGGLSMLDTENMFIWTWDARPFPDYPVRSDVWSDGDLWFYGHWWNGRIESVPLARLVAELCRLAGLTADQYDVTGLYGPGALVRGFQMDRPDMVRKSIEQLMVAYLFDAFESEGKIKFLLRSNTKTSAISADDIVVTESDPTGVSLRRGQETDLPSRVSVTYIDEFRDYNTATVDGKTARGYSQNLEEINVVISLTEEYAKGLADGVVQQRFIERETGTIELPPSLLRLDPGDAITFPVGTHSVTGRITTLSIGNQRSGEFSAFDPGIFSLPASPAEERLPGLVDIIGTSLLVIMDLPLFTGQEPAPWAPRIVADADPWPGAVSVYRRLTDGTYQFNVRHPYRNPVGRLNTALPAGPVGTWDRTNTLDVTFDYGALSSSTEAEMLASGLALGVYNAALDEWEVIQFATAALSGERTYNVTDTLRGQLGTEHAMGVPAGSTVVLLEPALLTPLSIADAVAGAEQTYSWGPVQYPQTDDTYQSAAYTGKRVGLRPYAVAGLNMGVNTAGDLDLVWARRTRFGGDSWTADEVPLNEETEQYRVRVYDGAVVVREIVTTSPDAVYSVAEQVADFGTAQTTLTVDVAQYGAYFGGHGIVTERTLSIKRAKT